MRGSRGENFSCSEPCIEGGTWVTRGSTAPFLYTFLCTRNRKFIEKLLMYLNWLTVDRHLNCIRLVPYRHACSKPTKYGTKAIVIS